MCSGRKLSSWFCLLLTDTLMGLCDCSFYFVFIFLLSNIFAAPSKPWWQQAMRAYTRFYWGSTAFAVNRVGKKQLLNQVSAFKVLTPDYDHQHLRVMVWYFTEWTENNSKSHISSAEGKNIQSLGAEGSISAPHTVQTLKICISLQKWPS